MDWGMSRWRPAVVTMLLVLCVIMAIPVAVAAQGNSGAAKDCQNDGHRTLAREENPTEPFRNTGECVRYIASEGGVLVPLVVVDPVATILLDDSSGTTCDTSWMLSGFVPNDSVLVNILIYESDGQTVRYTGSKTVVVQSDGTIARTFAASGMFEGETVILSVFDVDNAGILLATAGPFGCDLPEPPPPPDPVAALNVMVGDVTCSTSWSLADFPPGAWVHIEMVITGESPGFFGRGVAVDPDGTASGSFPTATMDDGETISLKVYADPRSTNTVLATDGPKTCDIL